MKTRLRISLVLTVLAIVVSAEANLGNVSAALQSLTRQFREHPGDNRVSVMGIDQRLAWIRSVGQKPAFQSAYRAWLWQRSYPFDSPDWAAFARAARVRDEMENANHLDHVANWIEQGPVDLDTPARIWHGPKRALTGRINGIAVHPLSATTVMIATAGGGVWKTTDGGTSWSSKSSTWPSMQTTSIAYHPKDGNKVYAGTGDSRGFFRLFGRGVYRSTDGGETWLTNNNLDGSAVSEIAVDPDNGKILAATSGRADYVWQVGQLYLSDDGITFTAQAAPGMAVWQGVSIGPRDRQGKRSYYAIGYTLPSGGSSGQVQVWRRDGAGNWTNITPTGAKALKPIATDTDAFNSGVDIVASPVKAGVVYLVSGLDRKVLDSDTSGASWDDVTTAGAPLSDAYNWSQSGYNFFLSCSYTPGGNEDILYLGQITVAGRPMSTPDWTDLGKTYTPSAALTHNDHHALAHAPSNPNLVYIGNDGGLYRTTYVPATRKWTNVFVPLNANLNVIQFYHGASGPNSGEYLGGTQDNANPRSFGPNSPHDNLPPSTLRWNNAGSGDGSFAAINPTNPLDSYICLNGSLRRTLDGWKDLTVGNNGSYLPETATQFGLWFPDYKKDSASAFARGALDVDGKILFYSSYDNATFTTAHLFRYSGAAAEAGSRFDRVPSTIVPNDGKRRFRLGPDARFYAQSGFAFDRTGAAASDGGWISAVAIAPGDRNTVYVGTSTGRVFMTKNAHASVTAVSFSEITRNLAKRFVSDVIVHENDPNHVWVVLGGTGDTKDYVWVNADTRALSGAGNWTDIDNGLPPISHNTIARDSGNLYVGNDVGVFTSTNNGATWVNATQSLGLPNVHVNKLVMNPATGNLDAFTFGRGVWSLALGANKLVGFGLQDLLFTGNRVNVEGRIVLNRPVAADTEVLLSTDEPGVFIVPPKTTMLKGENSALFRIDVVPRGTTSAFIAAEIGGETYTVVVTSRP